MYLSMSIIVTQYGDVMTLKSQAVDMSHSIKYDNIFIFSI